MRNFGLKSPRRQVEELNMPRPLEELACKAQHFSYSCS